jgi:hypothetical protein
MFGAPSHTRLFMKGRKAIASNPSEAVELLNEALCLRVRDFPESDGIHPDLYSYYKMLGEALLAVVSEEMETPDELEELDESSSSSVAPSEEEQEEQDADAVLTPSTVAPAEAEAAEQLAAELAVVSPEPEAVPTPFGEADSARSSADDASDEEDSDSIVQDSLLDRAWEVLECARLCLAQDLDSEGSKDYDVRMADVFEALGLTALLMDEPRFYDIAAVEFEKCIALRELWLDPTASEVAFAWSKLGECHSSAMRLRSARDAYDNARAILERKLHLLALDLGMHPRRHFRARGRLSEEIAVVTDAIADLEERVDDLTESLEEGDGVDAAETMTAEEIKAAAIAQIQELVDRANAEGAGSATSDEDEEAIEVAPRPAKRAN